MERKMTPEEIARAVYEVHAAYARSIGETYDRYEDAPGWKLRPLYANVRRLIRNPGLTPDVLHELWMAEKAHDGWKYGPEKCPVKRTHPLMVPWEEIPPRQQMKDVILVNVVRTLAPVAEWPGNGEDGYAGGAGGSGGGAGWHCAAPGRTGFGFSAPVTVQTMILNQY